MGDEVKPPTPEQLRGGIEGLSRNLEALFDAHNNLVAQVEFLSAVYERVKIRRGGPEVRVCGLCLATDANAAGIIGTPLLLFPHEAFVKICGDCQAIFKQAEEKAKELGKRVREAGA